MAKCLGFKMALVWNLVWDTTDCVAECWIFDNKLFVVTGLTHHGTRWTSGEAGVHHRQSVSSLQLNNELMFECIDNLAINNLSSQTIPRIIYTRGIGDKAI